MSKATAAKCRILVVIDQSEELSLIRYAVQKCGYQLWEANTAALALQLVYDHQPNLVLLDASPSSLEQDKLSLLIDHLHQQQIPTILITSKTPGQELKKCLGYPILDYIQRPIDIIGLVWQIKAALRDKGVQTELELIKQRLKENDRKLQQLQQCTIFDDSTGVFKYSHLLNLVKLEFARGVRHNTSLAFILIDIPYLRQINEDYGSQAKERLLREVAQLIKNSLRVIDITGRSKKDELGILLPETDLASAKLVANRTFHLVKDHDFSLPSPAETPGEKKASSPAKPPIKLDITLGLSAYPDRRVANYEELIEAARKSLSLAKEQDNLPPCLCNDCPSNQVVGIRS